jgi:hypothetical protein
LPSKFLIRSTVALGAIALATVALLTGYLVPKVSAATGPIPLNCDRACLENLIDQYWAAVVARDPKRLPLSQDVKYTENDQVMDIGDGFWKTAEGRGTYPFTNDCHRIENGSPTTNVPRPANEPPGTINAFAMDCLSQFKLGYYFVVQSIHHRRYPVVDLERGVVWSHAVFDQGTVNKGVLSDGREYAFKGFNRPSSILVTEAFLIENGKIRRVEMIGPSVPYHLNSA